MERPRGPTPASDANMFVPLPDLVAASDSEGDDDDDDDCDWQDGDGMDWKHVESGPPSSRGSVAGEAVIVTTPAGGGYGSPE